MNWLLRLFSPRAWQRHQFQQLQAQLTELMLQIQGYQFEMTQAIEHISTETQMRLDNLQATVEQLSSPLTTHVQVSDHGQEQKTTD